MKSQLNTSTHGDLTAALGYTDLRTSKSHLRHRKSDRRLLVLYLTVLIVQNCEFYCVNFRCTHAHFDQSIPSHSPPSASFLFFNNNPLLFSWFPLVPLDSC